MRSNIPCLWIYLRDRILLLIEGEFEDLRKVESVAVGQLAYLLAADVSVSPVTISAGISTEISRTQVAFVSVEFKWLTLSF